MSEFRGRDTESVNITLASGRFFRPKDTEYKETPKWKKILLLAAVAAALVVAVVIVVAMHT